MAKGWTVVRMIMTLDMDVTAERRHYNTHCPQKGKRLTTFCASLALLPNVFAVHRFAQGAADWRSGPRWSILSMLCPVHPFPLRGTSPRWEACHWIRGSRGSPMNPVSLPPQGETRDMREKAASHILHVPFRRFPPLVAVATTLPSGKHVICHRK